MIFIKKTTLFLFIIVFSSTLFADSWHYNGEKGGRWKWKDAPEEFRYLPIEGCEGYVKFPDTDSICEATHVFNKLYSNNFSLGGCSISIGANSGVTDCFTKNLDSLCENLVENNVVGPMRAALGSSSEFNFLKGDSFKKTGCEDRRNPPNTTYPSGKTDEDINDESSLKELRKKFGLFSSSVDDYRDCLKINGDKCKEEGYEKLPKDSKETEKIINESATQIAVADETISSRVLSLQVEISKKVKDCGRDQNCVNKVMQGDASPSALIQKELARIEIASAMELKIINKATRGDTYYVFKGKEDIKIIPLDERMEYMDGARRQNAADTLIRSLYKEIIDIKKEAIAASYGGISVENAGYGDQEGIESLQRGLDGYEALAEGEKEDGEDENNGGEE